MLRGADIQYRTDSQTLAWWVAVAVIGLAGAGLFTGVVAGEGSAGQTVELSTNGTLEGEVIDAETGEPLENASVIVANTENISVSSVSTDADGTYELPLEPGTYAVGVLEDGYEPEFDLQVTVPPGETIEYDIALEPTDGDPAVAFVDDPQSGAKTNHFWGTVVSDDQNRTLEAIELDYSDTGANLNDIGELDLFVILNGEPVEPVLVENVDSETLKVDLDPPFVEPPEVSPGDFVAVAMINEQVVNPPTPSEYEPEIELREGGDRFTGGTAPLSIVNETGTLTGVVSDETTGEAVEDAAVVAVNESDGEVGGALTGDDGSYEATLVSGEYNVTISHQEYEPTVLTNVTVTDGKTPLDANLTPATETFVLPEVETTPVEAGEQLTVEPTVINTGQVNGTQTVELVIDETVVESANVSLGPGETWEGPLQYETDESDQPTVSVSVVTGNASAERVVQVHEPVPDFPIGDVSESGEVELNDVIRIQQHLVGMNPEPFNENLANVDRGQDVTISDVISVQQHLTGIRAGGNASVTELSAPDQVTAGEPLNISATIENTGGMGTVQAAEFRIAEDKENLTANTTEAVTVVDLGPGDAENTSETVTISNLLPGEYVLGLLTEDTMQTTTFELTVPDPDTATRPPEVRDHAAHEYKSPVGHVSGIRGDLLGLRGDLYLPGDPFHAVNAEREALPSSRV